MMTAWLKYLFNLYPEDPFLASLLAGFTPAVFVVAILTGEYGNLVKAAGWTWVVGFPVVCFVIAARRGRKGVVGAVVLVLLMAGGVGAQPSNFDANTHWLTLYESEDEYQKGLALALVTGIAVTAQTFIPRSECPRPNKISMMAVAARTARLLHADMTVQPVFATLLAWGHEVGCPVAVNRWIRHAKFPRVGAEP